MSYTKALCQSVCLQSKHLGTDDITFFFRQGKNRTKKYQRSIMSEYRVLEKCMHNTYQSKSRGGKGGEKTYKETV